MIYFFIAIIFYTNKHRTIVNTYTLTRVFTVKFCENTAKAVLKITYAIPVTIPPNKTVGLLQKPTAKKILL
jgi:hypothetical protein